MPNRVGVIVGSLRKAAYSRMLARALPELTPSSLQLIDIGIGELPLYNYDLETERPPPAWTAFRTAVKSVDAVLFVTPEFNRCMPGAVKNAMDVGSRPWGDSAWSGKPAAIFGASPGALGTARAQYHLRQMMVFLDMHPLNRPEVMIGHAATKFDKDGHLTDEETRKRLGQLLEALASWTRKLRGS